MNKGIHQECPIFAILYLFVVEILSERMKNFNGIEGNSDKEIKHFKHADDITLTLKNSYSLSHAVILPTRQI